MLFGKLLPREGNFFEMFNQHAERIVEAANLLEVLLDLRERGQDAEAIAAAGGLVVVQDPASASMPAMPHAALARVAVHHVLPPAGIADLLAHLHENCLL